ncbi:universal stress protein [Nitratireductor mangrovi]|uniref:Universal stress protein n=1 Tax=Nitratireductor mangrovi TaxID=2599600 RepID=A0A5B8L1K6_9HYPH|nr:universal stress protein [Nitratireductor mangrovi]QDZ01542.1 universal stress protein [Nitratireductor mangrovi]
MPPARLAYMPLTTYPDIAPDDSVAVAVTLAAAFECELHVTSFAVAIPRVSTPIGGLLVNIPELVRAAEDDSRARCHRIQAFVRDNATAALNVQCSMEQSEPSSTGDDAAEEARYFDLVLLPWSKDSSAIREFGQSVVFGAGRPSILVPADVDETPIKHAAVAWDGSRVAARAVADLVPLLTDDCRITVLTVRDDKPLPGPDLAQKLAASLGRRGFSAEVCTVDRGNRTISEALQEDAIKNGARLLAMGGFGHSRVRDFILGGATRGVFADLRLPVLLSH